MTMTFKQLLAEAAKEKVDLRLSEVTESGDDPVLATFAPAAGGKGRTFTVEVDNDKSKVVNHGHFEKDIVIHKSASVGKTEDLTKLQTPPAAKPAKKIAAKKASKKKTAAKKSASSKKK